jgi:autotransporter-associated beta strand protein
MGGSSFGIHSGEVSFGLAAQGLGSSPWSRYANGVGRPAPFGLETVTAGRTQVEQFLTVGRHEGTTNWRWRFTGLPANLTPRVGGDGYVAFLVGTGAVKRLSQDAFIAPPAILDARGKRIPQKNLHWTVSSVGGHWWLNLRIDDSKLPTPYVIDPIAIRGTATSTSTSHGTTIVLTAPTGVLANDVMVAQVTTRNNAAISNSGGLAFTQIGSTVTNGATIEQAIWQRVATASEGGSTTTLSWTGSVDATGGIVAFSGVNTTTPVDASTSNTGTTGGVAPGACSSTCKATASAVTTTEANDEILAFYGTTGTSMSNDVTVGQDASQNVSQQYTVLSGSSRLSQVASTGSAGATTQAAAGSTGNFTATINHAGTPWITHTVALQAPTCTACTWTGGGGDNNWTTGANWSGGFAPAINGTATLTFPTGAARLSNTNDEPAGTTFAGINFTFVSGGVNYTLAGNGVTLGAGGITDSSGATNTISLPLTATAVRPVSVTSSTLILSGVFSGSGGGITKSGPGVLTLSGGNTFTGGVTLSAGQLNINNATALGTGTFTITGGVISNTSGGSITESNNNAQAWNGDFSSAASNPLNLGTGAVAMNNSRTVSVTGATLTVGGVISGSTFGLTKAGAGTLILTGANTYTGNTTISAGTLNANSTSALGGASSTLIFSGGTLQAGGTITSPSTRSVTLSSTGTIDTNGQTVSIAGVISGGNGLTKSGTGTLTLTGTNTYSGATTISAGTLNANASAAIGDGSATNTLVFSGGTLQAGGTIASPSTRTVTLSSAGTIDTNAQSVSIAGVISGANGLTKSGTGTLTLTGTNTYGGSTTISAGTLNANASAAIGDGSATNTLILNGGTLQAGGTITSPSTRGVTLSSTGTIDTNSNAVSIAGVIGGAGSITKSGAGTLTLTGTNTYSGSTTISGGTLNANASAAIGNGSATNTLVFSGGTLQAGGTITSPSTRAVTLSSTGTIDTNGNAVSVAGVISGSGSIAKSGSGTLTLTGTNTYSGSTTISAGTLNANATAAIGDGSATNTLVFAGGTLQAAGTITSPSTRAVTLSSTGTIDTNGNAVSIAGVISGSGAIAKSGAGTLTLTGNNTYSGSTTISAGTLNANASAAIGDGSATNTLVFSGGTLQAGGTITSPSTRAVTLSSTGTIDTNGNNVSIAGVISGSNGLTKSGAGTLTLTGTNTYSGATTISAGTVSANSSAALGDGSATNTLVFAGGTLQAGGAITSPATRGVTLSSAGTINTNGNNVSIAGVISGANGLTKSGAGTLTLTGTNTYSGSTTISAGTLNANSSSALGDESATNTLVFAGGTLQAGGTITSPSTRGVTLSSTGTIDTNGNNVSIAGAISGANGLTKNGAGTLTLTGTNTYSGATTISVGTVNANSSAALGDGSATNTLGLGAGTTLQASGTITSPSTRSVTLFPSGTVTIDTNGNSVSIAGVIGGFDGLTKSGSGTLTLSANNTYSGTTTVSAGTLTVNGSQGSSAVSLNGGTLNGTGTTGAITSTASGGTLQPGTPPGILSSGNVNLSSGSPTFSVALNGTTAGSGYSQLNVTGTVNLTGATLSGSLGYTPTNGDSYTIINNDSTDAVTGTFAGLPEGTGLVIGGKSFRISYVGGSGNDVVLTAGGATKLAVTSVPANATANVNFSVTVQSQDANGNCVQVNSNTAISLASDGAGALSGNTGTILAGTCSVTLNAVQDFQGETIHLTASRTSGDSLTTSAASSAIVVANGTFTTNTAVSVSGTPTVGTPITATPGSYTPTPTGASYQWQLCDSGGGSCANIGGATSISYTPVAGDVGGTLKVIETVTRSGYNNGGSTSAASAIVIKGSFTTNTAVSVSGTPTVGTASTATPGSYTPTPTGASYQWQLCDSGGGSCANIGGATSISYTPVAGDVGGTLKVIETVTRSGYNNGGSTSAATAIVIKGSFTTVSAVSVNGPPIIGTTTTITNGVYSVTASSRSYQWELCDSGGASCTDIVGATSNTYTPVSGDLGSTVRVVETVSRAGYNDGGSTSAAALVVIGVISTTTDVAINGTPTVDAVTTITPGSYSPAPTSITYQWRLCDSAGNNCSDISGETSNTYTPVASDAGSTLRVVETASKSGYADAVSTSGRALVANATFTTDTAVSISGTPTVGTAFASTAGSYTPTPTSVSYQWERCDSFGSSCSNISNATASSYTPVAGDVGSTLRVVETVSSAGYDDGGSTTSASAVVINGSFSTTTAASINGTPTVGSATTLTAGSYTPAPTSVSYQWELCDSLGNSCSPIGGATSSTYTPVPGDVGSTLRVIETVSKAGYNDGGGTPSAQSPVVIKGSFSKTTAVVINGAPTVGAVTTITTGVYAPTATSRSYQWKLCDSAGNSCSPIGGATSTTYTPISAQVGLTLRVVETTSKAGYNDGGSTSSAVVVRGVFATTVAVTITGTPTVGTMSKITAGTYTPAPVGRSYQWERCDGSGNNCVAVAGATFNVYTPVAGDVGKTLRVVETVSKSFYFNSGSTSAATAPVVMGTFVKHTTVQIYGYPKRGVTSHVTQGSYTPTPASRTYQWLRCGSTALTSCVNISGATKSTYKPGSADYGKRLRVVETVSKPGYNNLSVTSAAAKVQ